MQKRQLANPNPPADFRNQARAVLEFAETELFRLVHMDTERATQLVFNLRRVYDVGLMLVAAKATTDDQFIAWIILMESVLTDTFALKMPDKKQSAS